MTPSLEPKVLPTPGRVCEYELVRRNPYPPVDHRVMPVEGGRLRVDDDRAVVLHVGKAHIGFNGHMGLPLGVELLFDHIRCARHDRLRLLPLDVLHRVKDVRGTRMNLNGTCSHGRGGAHVGGQSLQLHLYLRRRGPRMGFGVGADDGYGVAILENLIVAQDGTIQSVAQVVRVVDRS